MYYTFESWSGDTNGCTINSNEITVTMNQDRDILAILNLGDFYQLEVNVSSNGTITPEDVNGLYSSGASVTVTSTPAARFSLAGWSGDTNGCIINGNVITAIMDQDRNILATMQEHFGPNTTNTLNYEETFESYQAGFAMPGTNGWSANSFSNAVVTTNSWTIQTLNEYNASCGYPINANHAKALRITGTVTNSFDVNANKKVWIDKMIQVNGVESIDPSLLINAQASFYFDTDFHPMVWHRNLVASSNCWTKIPEVTGDAGKWVRLTIGLDYLTEDTINTVRYFQIKLDGNLLTNTLAWTSNDGAGTPGGSWFAMPSNPDKLNEVVFKGAGSAIDDLVVTTYNPFDAGGSLMIIR